MKKAILAVLAVLVLLGAAFGGWWFSLDKEQRALYANVPSDRNLLRWTMEQRDIGFRMLDRAPGGDSRVIKAGGKVLELPDGPPLQIDMDPVKFMDSQRSAALVIVHNGEVVYERYGLDFSADGKWASFSVAKSITSTLVGAAVKDGAIESLDDPVSKYITDFQGSPYEDVTVEQLLTMTSGVKWSEDYEDPNSDVSLFINHKPEEGVDTTVSYMRQLEREAPPGEKWAYKTGETNLIGVLVSEATGINLSDYLSQKIWKPYGMQQDAAWLLGTTGAEISGCCMQAATRDMARFGLFMLGGGIVDGESILPEGWIEAATTKREDIGTPGEGYGYQWWTYDGGEYAAIGIFGQGIFIDPARNLVIASNASWPMAYDIGGELVQERARFYRSVQDAVDALEARAEEGDPAPNADAAADTAPDTDADPPEA